MDLLFSDEVLLARLREIDPTLLDDALTGNQATDTARFTRWLAQMRSLDAALLDDAAEDEAHERDCRSALVATFRREVDGPTSPPKTILPEPTAREGTRLP